jgi:hypothetical protein
LEFTGLERAVFSAISQQHQSIGVQLRDLLATARISERENTGHGFYTRFNVDSAMPAITSPERMLSGPNADVSVGHEALQMGFVLWLDGGYPVCLEGFQYGTQSGQSIDLKQKRLSDLEWLQLTP